MRFYLDVPLFVGYVLMATLSCLGMLQLVAAKGQYSGLSLFTGNNRTGKRIGVTLTVGAVIAYVLFAPDILTPGPAGTEVAEMFAACALIALGVTLVGADVRMRGSGDSPGTGGISVTIPGLDATYFDARAGLTSEELPVTHCSSTVILLKDPSGFVSTPRQLIEALQSAGLSVLELNLLGDPEGDGSHSATAIQECLEAAVDWLEREKPIESDAGAIGLMGCGLGGDAVLWAAEADARIAAALGVAPLPEAPRPRNASENGVDWLRELSYRQTWRWHRRWSAMRRTATDMALNKPRHWGKNASRAVFVGREPQTAVIGAWSDVEILSATDGRHFSLLEKVGEQKVAVDWLWCKLCKP
jgi:dienelactone hydrolase